MNTPAYKKHYLEKIIPALIKSLGYKNHHQVPAIEKIVINSGINAVEDKNRIEEVLNDITLIAGQKAVLTKAKKSISNFKLREGMPIGVKVTLRGSRMYDFLYRLINISLPVIRDFRGVSSKLDGHGNYTIGITDHSIFPEVRSDGNKRNTGMDITIVTTTQGDDEGRELLKQFGMPFRKSGSS